MYLFYEKCRVNKYIEFCIYSLYFVLITLVFLNFGNPVITISFNICSIFVFTLMYDYISLKKSMVVTFIIYLILCLIDLSVISIINFNLRFNINILNGYTSMLTVLINFTINNNIFYIIILNVCVLFFNIVIFKYYNLIFRNIYEKIFDKIFNYKVNTYKKEIQTFEHKCYFKKYINSNNYIVDGILNSKIHDLDEETKLNFNIFMKEDLKINLDDLLIIIGNLMDNVISGVNSTSQDREKYVDISIIYVKGTIIFNIKNSFNGTMLKKKEGRLFCKKEKFDSYGLGLLIVKEIVEKYKGILEIKFNKNNFQTYVLLYDIKV